MEILGPKKWDHRDERQGEPALAFSILGLHPSLRIAALSEEPPIAIAPGISREDASDVKSAFRTRADSAAVNEFITVSGQFYCTFRSSARISSAVLTSGTELLTLR